MRDRHGTNASGAQACKERSAMTRLGGCHG
jgi:hypothetical protein